MIGKITHSSLDFHSSDAASFPLSLSVDDTYTLTIFLVWYLLLPYWSVLVLCIFWMEPLYCPNAFELSSTLGLCFNLDFDVTEPLLTEIFFCNVWETIVFLYIIQVFLTFSHISLPHIHGIYFLCSAVVICFVFIF